MKAEVSRIILFVDDIDNMSAFYGGVLGLDKLPGSDVGFVCFAAGGCEICLHILPEQYRSAVGEYRKREDSYVKFVFRSDNVERDRQELNDHGVVMGEIRRFGMLRRDRSGRECFSDKQPVIY